MTGTTDTTRTRWALSALGLLALVGCAFRFLRLHDVGLWYDELWTVVGAADAKDLAALYREWLLGDPHPPGFTLAYRAWFTVVPPTELWARLPAAVAGVLTVAMVGFGADRCLNAFERAMAACFLALSHGALLYAQTCKQYAPMLLLQTVLLISTLEALTTPTPRRRVWWLGGASALGLVWLDVFGTVFAALCFVAMLMALWRTDARRPLLTVFGVVSLGSLPIVAFHAMLLRYAPGDWQHDSWAALAADVLPHLFFQGPHVAPAVLALAGALISSLLFTPNARATLRTRRNAWLAGLAGGTVLFLLALGTVKPIAFIRYFLVAFPPVLVLLGVLAAAAFPSWRVVVPVAFFTFAAAGEWAFFRTFDRQHWDRSVDLVLKEMGPDDVVCVLGAKQDKTMFEYLQAGDEWGLYYVRNPSFYRYYFRRRGAPSVADRLEVVQPRLADADALVDRYAGSGRRVWVLGGHHLKYDEDAFAALERRARSARFTQLFSTRVYELQF